MVFVSKKIAELGAIRVNKTSAPTRGCLLHVTVENPSSNPLHVIGMYCPPHSGQQEHRQMLYQECQGILDAAPATHHTVIVAGDFNATIQPEDRVSGTTSSTKNSWLVPAYVRWILREQPQTARTRRAATRTDVTGQQHHAAVSMTYTSTSL